MNIESAKLFVEKMRKDKVLRGTIQEIHERSELWKYLEIRGYAFDECDLVKAMSACMTELEASV